jgi:hypothetical protein
MSISSSLVAWKRAMAASAYAVALPRCVMSLIISAMLSPEKQKKNKVEQGLGTTS